MSIHDLYRHDPKPHSLVLLAIVSAILVTLVVMTSAKADTWSSQCDQTGCYNHFFNNPSSPKIILVPEDESKEAQDRYDNWVAYCQPKAETRAYGVQYLVYAHEGCEYGRSK